MTKHTPGPWRVYEGDPLIVCFGEGDSICDAAPGSPFVSWDLARANAKLIAAAPALLDFAKWVETWVSNPASSYSTDALDGLFGMARDRLAAVISEER